MIRVFATDDQPGAFCDLHWTLHNSANPTHRPIIMREFAQGVTVHEREMNGYNDSDFYATYYNAETDSFDEVMYASTRGWTYPCHAVIDATPEIFALWEERKQAERKAYAAHLAAIEAKRPTKGKTVRILPNRGKAKAYVGKTGQVFYYQESFSQYGTWSRGYRVGVKIDGQGVFLAADKCEVVQP